MTALRPRLAKGRRTSPGRVALPGGHPGRQLLRCSQIASDPRPRTGGRFASNHQRCERCCWTQCGAVAYSHLPLASARLALTTPHPATRSTRNRRTDISTPQSSQWLTPAIPERRPDKHFYRAKFDAEKSVDATTTPSASTPGVASRRGPTTIFETSLRSRRVPHESTSAPTERSAVPIPSRHPDKPRSSPSTGPSLSKPAPRRRTSRTGVSSARSGFPKDAANEARPPS